MLRIRSSKTSALRSRELRAYLTSPTSQVFIALEDGVEAGFVEVHPNGKHLEITKLVVARRFRNQGIGRRLLTHVEKIAKRRGHATIQLRAHSLDTGAMNTANLEEWYRRNGYVALFGPGHAHTLRKALA